MSDPILLETVIYARWELGEDFFDECLAYFTQTSALVSQELWHAFEEQNWEQFMAKAHDLKGLCSNLGLARFAKHLALMENLAQTNEIPSLKIALARLNNLAEEAISALKDYKASQA